MFRLVFYDDICTLREQIDIVRGKIAQLH